MIADLILWAGMCVVSYWLVQASNKIHEHGKRLDKLESDHSPQQGVDNGD